MTRWRRKPNRLPADVYAGSRAYFVTTAYDARARHFDDESIVDLYLLILQSSATAEHFSVLAYVFMPDHLHLLVQGQDDSNLARFMKRFKQETSFRFKQKCGMGLWQKSFHDHVVRREEDLNDMAFYIAQNPVRAGFVDEWPDYLHWGGEYLEAAAGGDLKVAATGAHDSGQARLA